MGYLASLNRFISQTGDRCKPFFDALKKGKFDWTDHCQSAFISLKDYLTNAQVLSKPIPGEKLYFYLAALDTTISAVLIRSEAKTHLPIYYVSQALRDTELQYSPFEKLAYSLVMIVRKLRPLGRHIMTYPLYQVLHWPDTTGHLLKWSLKIGQFGIIYTPRTAIKGQVLADFIIKLTFLQGPDRNLDHP